MTTTAPAERKKAPSTELLEPGTYADQPLERLEAERLTISNRLSGVNTQLKRLTDDSPAAKRKGLERRRSDLLKRRDKLGKAIADARRQADEQNASTDVVATLEGRAAEAAQT